MNQACLNFGGDDLSAYAEFRCVEPLRKLVTTEKTADDAARNRAIDVCRKHDILLTA